MNASATRDAGRAPPSGCRCPAGPARRRCHAIGPTQAGPRARRRARTHAPGSTPGSLRRSRPAAGRPGSLAEAGQALADVGGVADLAHLAVVDDVDAGRDLLPDDLGDGVLTRAWSRARPVASRWSRLRACRPGRRAGQAAGVGGEDPIGAVLHRCVPSIVSDALPRNQRRRPADHGPRSSQWQHCRSIARSQDQRVKGRRCRREGGCQPVSGLSGPSSCTGEIRRRRRRAMLPSRSITRTFVASVD